MNEALERPAVLVPSGEQIAQLEQASAMASEVTNTVLSQRLELEERKRSVTMLQKALVRNPGNRRQRADCAVRSHLVIFHNFGSATLK